MIDTAHHQEIYKADFARLARTTSGRALLQTRRAAFERFVELGFPTTRQEDWRFTNVAPIARTPFRLATRDGARVADGELADPLVTQTDWPRLVFINGHYAARFSSPGLGGGATIGSLAEIVAQRPQALEAHLARHAAYREHPFTALNTAFMTDGAFVHVPRGLVVERPLHLLFVSCSDADPTVSHPRNLIVAEAGSQATIIESYLGPSGGGGYLTNAVSEIVAGDNAVIDHYKVGREAPEAYHIGATQIHQSRDSTVASHAITLGGALVRNNITTVLDGQGGHCTLNGLYVISGRQHVDNHLRVEHAKPHCDSREFFKGILDQRAKAVFSGRIVVHKDAQKTDAKQTNMNLLLSEDAQVDTKPQLEIFADDVKCTHGATIGQIDEDAVFYLRSRGVNEQAARGVLIHAFAEESLERIRPGPLRRQLREMLLGRLPHGQMLREAI